MFLTLAARQMHLHACTTHVLLQMMDATVHVLCLYGFILLVNMNLPCNATIDESIIEEFKLSIGYLKKIGSRFLVR